MKFLARKWSLPSVLVLLGYLWLFCLPLSAKEMEARPIAKAKDTIRVVNTEKRDTTLSKRSQKARSKESSAVGDSVVPLTIKIDTATTTQKKRDKQGAVVVDTTKKSSPVVPPSQDALQITAEDSADVVSWDTLAFHNLESYWKTIYEKEKDLPKYSFRARRVLKSLFSASVDERNPEPDYRKSYEYASILSQQTKVFGKWNEYENWRVVLLWIVDQNKAALDLQEKYKALQVSANKNAKELKGLKTENGKLRQDINTLKKEKHDLQVKIEELKKLEVLLEQERRR